MIGYEKINIGHGINLMLINKENYKTNIATIYIKRPLKREEVTMNSLLPSVLKSGTKDYPSQREITVKMQELYGSNLGASVDKTGERQIMSFRLYTTADEFLPEPIFEEAFDILKKVVLDPKTIDDGFDPKFVDIEKENLREDINAKINNKGHYAVEKCIEHMCEGEPFSISEDGYIDDLDGINEKNLYKHYLNVIESSEIDIVIAGSFDRKKVIEIIQNTFSIKRESIIETKNEEIYKKPEPKFVEENLDITQGKLVMGFRTNMDFKNEKYYSLLMYSAILGGGAHSKMFLNIREKESLCYSIYSTLEKMKGLMFISAGIEISDYDKALELIYKEIDDMKNGNISKQEMENSRSYLVSNLRALNDSLSSLTDFYYNMSIQNTNRSLDDVIELVKKVKTEDVVEVAQDIYLDTVYFLKGPKNS